MFSLNTQVLTKSKSTGVIGRSSDEEDSGGGGGSQRGRRSQLSTQTHELENSTSTARANSSEKLASAGENAEYSQKRSGVVHQCRMKIGRFLRRRSTSENPSSSSTSSTSRTASSVVTSSARQTVSLQSRTTVSHHNVQVTGSGTQSFDQLLAGKNGLQSFREFAVQEFAEENLNFWLAIEEFKRLPRSEMASEAIRIHEEFVEYHAPSEINVDPATRENIRQSLSNPSADMFSSAQRRVHLLLESDIYPRFLQSDIYKNFKKRKSCKILA